MDDRKSSLGLFVLVAATAALTIGFHQLGRIDGYSIDWADIAGWAGQLTPEDAIAATLRSIGLGIAYWVLATTALYAATGLGNRQRRPGWIAAVTLPIVRRAVDRSLAISLAASIVATPLSPALAADPPPASVVVFDASDGIPVPHVRADATAVAVSQPEPDTTTSEPTLTDQIPPPVSVPVETASNHIAPVLPTGSGVAPTEIPVQDDAAITHTVAQGENLWLIADNHLATPNGTERPAGEVAEYWRRVVAANRKTLRSGDPNLIFAGELITLPEISEAP